eukprot:TRINITY_DN2714_c0_g3_i2.p1 TRINITY_DN2714_c0_g3~~TRINITY_DN2714_c0_g3_i2.p1  ORF type:complete len:172 (-),score=40.85 TRINITY_DN2714_c0_g3_i2:411-926(-)
MKTSRAAALCTACVAALATQGSAFMPATTATRSIQYHSALTSKHRGQHTATTTMSMGPLDSMASSVLLSAGTATEFGNIGTNSPLFQPIFLGGCIIMLSGVVVAYIVSVIVDRGDLYEELSEELGGKYEKEEYVEKAKEQQEALVRAKEQAVISEEEEAPVIADIVDEYND